ncbi:enoyl-CoA hydratase/isomerase family protein, partial [Mycobacterium sp. 1165178.9]|uniref:enoyl-CoA hydratase/isomerase family protein n=1 Tax=Mycobacterium sp. 1165178.9 TaxID=1834070 RepID=UPI000A4CD85E
AITLLRKSPMEAITRMTLSGKGERISAQRAYELGMVSDVVPADQLRAAAGRLAAAVATNSPTAMRATKKALWHSLEVGLSAAKRAASEEIWRLRNHPDHAEGVHAWRDKRPARWQPLDPVEIS